MTILETRPETSNYIALFRQLADEFAPMFGQFKEVAASNPAQFAKDMYNELGDAKTLPAESSSYYPTVGQVFHYLRKFLAEPANLEIYRGLEQQIITPSAKH